MSANTNEALRDIEEATQFQTQLSIDEVFELLGIENELSLEENIYKLFNVALNPIVCSLPREKRLAAIKTCEVIIGKLFLLSTGFGNIAQ